MMPLIPKYLDIRNVIETTAQVYAAFWNTPIGANPINERVGNIIEEQKIEASPKTFCQTFTALFFITSPEAIEACKEGVAELTEMCHGCTMIWDVSVLNRGDLWFIKFIYASIVMGVQSSLFPLCSISKEWSFAYEIADQRYSLQCKLWRLWLWVAN